ncbi:MAG: DUF3486 family protein [Deltaproteobacteria bacterium]|jgi:hypothetical protein|nr:DUF3486 family protein [Deltaproteobacteria bacterium]
MSKRSRVTLLPADVRGELDRRLVAGVFSNYQVLADWLEERGFAVGRHSVARYGKKLERRLEAVRLAALQAQEVVAAAPDCDAMMNDALMRLVQNHLFSLLIDLTPRQARQLKVSTLARSLGDLARAGLVQKRQMEQVRDNLKRKLNDAQDKLLAEARQAAGAAGLSPDTEQRIRQTLLQITP